MNTTTPPVTRPAILAATPATGLAWRIAAVAVGVTALTVSAKIQVPMWPVPMTLQTLAVLLIGGICGGRLAAATVAAYLVAGLAGAPIFAGATSGPAYFLGQTGGFLVGFLIAAWLVGTLTEWPQNRTVLRSSAIMLLGHVVVFAAGIAWIAASLGMKNAIAVGLMPFVLATIVKTGLAVSIMHVIWRRRTA